ncbi:MAG: phospholactate guanylyltransferase [Candidatus Methanoperedens nitroreducens]|uniref:2-phospho-L-lactate guanylyltransferase n=1 Tax=Candidatus Methanoperedens nitratireducens TaxID=1392998 RepID=A0A0P8DWC7_9EURY|nr:2-phospho-L-lactate guanylyltransferase [Candidatus Methanoperedens sp. BLZ2]KAB2947094.1 MAG: 2-phospho-L-lactate guanylyltransferase [Candidatus Methanoperedens sp.]KPQ41910.1 MAG: phospholactate guanylyltransferase [Candidatus Methanoperedens sp. BLZ1]MBZ0174190.1 2-phospho-L-lactate guanylyltransferase [Candidatus Methanoperedens nitroreducens]MCX9077710.1 2-phospho-L-lactate guanylyltransferase [Candidatus Methanoperedens sp.]
MRAVIPFRKSNAKSRLSSLLSEKEREELAMAMLNDVSGTLVSSGCFDVIDILSTSMIEIEGVNIVLTELGLNEALNEYLGKMSSHKINEPVLIIMADIPLVSTKNILDIVSTNADIVIAPGRMGGTNAIFIRDPASFHVDYYGASYLKHLKIASDLHTEVFDSFNLSTDIDEVPDIIEVLLHGKGYSQEYLKKIGIDILANGGRVGVKR